MLHFKKYSGIMRTTFVDIRAYKGEFIGVLIWTPVHFILLFFIWTIIYQNPQAEADFDYSLSAILGYALISTLISESLFLYRIAWRMQNDNLNGTLTIYLCRPVDYLAFSLAETIPFSLISFSLSLPVVIVLIDVMKVPIELNGFILFGFVLCLIISYILSFFCFILVGISTFYIRYIWPIRALFLAVMQVIGGELIPVDMLPSAARDIAYLLPFHLINFIPAQWILGRITLSELIFAILYGIFWIILLGLLTKYLWNRAIGKFESAGG
ncbi:MAG: ABC transporter permease [Candidatus Hodarchaeota archaeon]